MHRPVFVPLDAAFGARVEGLDLGTPFATETAVSLRAAMDEYHLLVVHVPGLDVAGQQHLAAVFGPLLDESRDGSGATLVSDQPGGSIREGPLLFHSDLAFTPTPLVAISLYALEIPAAGTSTHFADAVGAARHLPPSTVHAVESREAVHVYPLTDARGDRRFRLATVDPDAPRAAHPVLMPHPRTGAPVLCRRPDADRFDRRPRRAVQRSAPRRAVVRAVRADERLHAPLARR